MNRLQSAVGLAVLLVSGAALAQSSGGGSPYDLHGRSWLPFVSDGYVGLNVGRPRYQLGCAVGGCDQPDLAAHVYAGGMFSPFFGAEVGYLNFGELQRGGASTRAQGLNFSLVARASLGAGFGVFGRIGTTYGRTNTDAGPGLGMTAGRASGWGPAYGLGVDWAFSDHWSAVLDWQRHRFDLAGDDSGWVRATSVGLKYRF